MNTSVRVLAPHSEADRRVLMDFYLAHADGRLRQRVEEGSLSLDPRCTHLSAFDTQGRLQATVQALPMHTLDRGDYWLAFFESHAVPGGAAGQLLLFPPVAAGGAGGKEGLRLLLDQLIDEAAREGIETLLLSAPADRLGEFQRLGFTVYTNGRRGSGLGFLVPMVRAVTPAGADGPPPALRVWLEGVRARQGQFLVRDLSRPGPGLLGRLKRAF